MKELGVTLDFGHVIFGGTNPAEELVILAESGQPYYIHINDNDGKWDWDYFCGTKHLLEYAEFLWYLRRYGYQDYLTSDTSPTRWDIRGTFEANNRLTRKLWNLLGRHGRRGASGRWWARATTWPHGSSSRSACSGCGEARAAPGRTRWRRSSSGSRA